MTRLAVYCADVGSIKGGNFGWARAEVPAGDVEAHRGGAEIMDLAEALADDLDSDLPIALGFECPLFVPVPEEAFRLGAARAGEGSRSWSAFAGPTSLATGVVQASWILRELRIRCPAVDVYLDWPAFDAAGHGLFLWEAFVTGNSKAATHVEDATIAVACFRDALPDPTHANAVVAERPLSLIGAGLLWAGWSDDVALMHAPCLVVKAAATAV